MSRGKTDSPVHETPRPPALPRAFQDVVRDETRVGPHRFDKAFPVFLSSVRGVANGVGRNISAEGMFVETRDVCPIGSEVRITFEAPELATHVTAVAEVRFQAYLNYAGTSGETEGLRGFGVRFVRFEDDGRPGNPVTQ